MQRFVCEQNIVHFERLLNETADPLYLLHHVEDVTAQVAVRP